ncbi:unnamed protein product [Sphagnum troendelagicum]|uniref:RING-type E3 ubiquitin transferase n=1 Tax=Sphagnum troendelagicum TaxID=128251 RepID=A0ABP0TDU7_9BRYO
MDEAAGLKKSKGASTSSTTNTPLLLRTTPRSKEWPEDFVCPISRCLMADPVVVATGQSYERMCIQLWFQRGYRHCFKSGMAVMTPIVLTPNLQLRSAIVVWCDQHQVPRPRVPSLELATELLERVQLSQEYARVHPQSQDQEQSRGLTMWNPSRISHASSESDQYVHSATGRSLTEEIQTAAELGIHGIPLPLATKPSSYHSDELGLDKALVGMEAEILHKLQHKKHVEQEKGAAEIRSLTRTSEDYRLTLCTSAILGALLPLLQSKHARLQSDATAALMNLTLPQENKVKVARAGAIPYFIEVLKSKTEDAQAHAAGALFSLALNDDNKAPIGVLQAIPPLLHLLKSGPLEAQRDAAMALYHLSFLKMNRGKLLQAGAVALLMDLAGGESSAVASRVLLILNNLASGPEGRNAICEANGITELVHILAHRSLAPPLDPVREHAAAALLQLSHHNYRFKTQALRADAIKPLTMLAEHGNRRSKKKAVALLQILKDKPSEDDGANYADRFRKILRGAMSDQSESAQF